MKKNKLPKAARKAIRQFLNMQAFRQMQDMSVYLHQNYRSRLKLINKRFGSYAIAILFTIILVATIDNNVTRSVALPICFSLWGLLILMLLRIRLYFDKKERYYQQQSDIVQKRQSEQLALIR